MTNVTPIESKQPQAAAKFTITATLEGFPIQIEIENADANKLRGMIDRLKAIGATPPSKSHDVTLNGNNPVTDAPICEFHGAMKASNKKPGSWFCPHKMGNGEYCKSKA